MTSILGWARHRKWLLISTILVSILVSSLGIQVADRSNVVGNPIKIGVGNEKVITLGHVAYASVLVDYTYDGVDDNVQFQAALDALPATGGRIVDVSAVQKNFSATVTRAIPNVTIVGSGQGSYFANDGGTALFTAGGNNWKFEDLRTDAGGINMGATTGWQWINVNNGSGTVYDLRTPAGSIVNGAFTANTLNTHTIPAGTDTFAMLAATQELTNKTLNASVAKGTWTASGTWTIPAVTLGGTLTLNGQTLDAGSGGALITTSASDNGLIIRTSVASGDGARFYLSRSSNTIAVGNEIGDIYFQGKDAVGGYFQWGLIENEITDVGDGTEAALFRWNLANAGGSNVAMTLSSAGTGWFDKNLEVDEYIQQTEMAAPGAGAANTVRTYAVVGGDTLTDYSAVFQDGTVVIIAEETTPLDSPIFKQPSGVTVIEKMIKPHPGLIQFVMEYPTGEQFVIRQIEYHDAEKIAANDGSESTILPDGWEVTTSRERIDKQVGILDKEIDLLLEERLTSTLGEVESIDKQLAELYKKRQLEVSRKN